MRCAKCGGDIVEIPMKNNDDVEGYYYFCNKCNRAFWISPDGDIIDSPRILGMDLSKREVRKKMKCNVCSGRIVKTPNKSSGDINVCCYRCNGCNRIFLAIDGHRCK